MSIMKGGSSENQTTDSQDEVVERVKARLQEEGREARNLVAYSLPLLDPPQTEGALRHREVKRVVEMVPRRELKQDKRPRSASAGRDPQASLRARHWGFLFRNLQQAVDEIYQTCEDDESIVECKEAILMLERYSSDFQKLIEWLKLKWEYEHTPPPQRPTSLTWEIRTSSPGKAFHQERRAVTLSEARRALTFESKLERSFVVNGTVHEKKGSERVNMSKSDASNNEAKDLPCLISPQKPVIIVHRAGIDKKQEECPQKTTIPKENDLILEEVLDDCLELKEDCNKENIDSSGNGNLQTIKKSDKHVSENETNIENLKEDNKTQNKEISSIIKHEFPRDCTTDSSCDKDKVTRDHCETTDTKKITDVTESNGETSAIAEKITDSQKLKEVTPVKNAAITTTTKTRDSGLAKTKDSIGKVQKTKEAETTRPHDPGDPHQSSTESTPGKSPSQKPGPTVYMNKASQVRQAYNQNKTPQKHSRSLVLNGRQWSGPRFLDSRNNISKQQAPGSKLSYRRMPEGKNTASPPLGRRSATTDTGGSRNTFANGLVRSHSSLHYGRGLGNSSRTTSSSSLSSNTSSSGQSWADKVRGAPLSLESSQLSLQDDGEGWEVVRRGRRSHGGSTASLNSNHYNPKDVRSGSLKTDGHSCEMKKRFHAPSTAMSMPSLIISENNASDDASKEKSSSSGHFKQNTKKSSLGTGTQSSKKVVTESISAPLVDGEANVRQQNSHVWKRIERRNKKAEKGADEITKDIRCKESNLDVSVIDSSDQKGESKNKDKTCDETVPGSVLVHEKNRDDKDVKSESAENTQEQEEECSLKNFLESNNLVCNHRCDPAIPEISETSDAEDDESKEKNISKAEPKSSSVPGTGEEETADLDQQADPEVRNFDNESQMDEEELLSNAAALESAFEEEQRLKQQIEETEKTEIKVEDVDCEEDGSDASESAGRALSPLALPFDNLLSTMSWADQVDAFESLEELRHPGRVLHIHEKLSSPSRKRSLSEKMRRHEEKIAKAQELRENLMLVKTEKLKDLFKKIEEVRQDKEGLLVKKRDLFQRKMKRAEEKRKQYLQEIVNKAHDEENKAKEIAFINGLEAKNKLHDIMQQHQSHESRLADMAEERTRRQEEKAAKEVAAQERRKALEAERQARMAELCEKRRQKCERIDRQQAERREELLEQAREKARDREERLSALQQAQQAKETELVKKIQQKQEESARRHEENIELIRQRALESSILKYSRGCDEAPKLIRYETKKLCTLCNSLITSEVYLLSHLRGRRHQEALRALHQADVVSSEDSETYNLKHIVDAPANIDDPQITRDKERHKALKRRCRKIRTRMVTRGKEFNSAFKPVTQRESPNKIRINKSLQQIAKLIANQGSGPWSAADLTALDRPLLELIRILEKKDKADQAMFSALSGFTKIDSVLKTILETTEQRPCVLPAKSLGYSGKVLLGGCRDNYENCRYVLYSNLVGVMIDYLIQRMNSLVSEGTRMGSNNSINAIVNLPSDAAAGAVFEVLAEVIQVLCQEDLLPAMNTQDQAVKDKAEATWHRLQDVVSYCVSVGLVDKVSWYFSHVQGPLDNEAGVVDVILSAMRLITALAKTLSMRTLTEDPTQLIGTLHVTDACGVVSLLYGLLLHQGGRSAMPQAPPKLSQTAQALTIAATMLLHSLALLDLTMFQAVLGGEGISLEFRHIASFLLWYCSTWPCEDILHNIIPLVGFFAINNKENQMVIQSGEVPSVLQQLCNLPWQYFSEPSLTAVLFPTLLACCLNNDDNMIILQQEMSFQVLEDFLQNCQAVDKPLVHILKNTK
ncbi:S phase cyclin A-associated protein in the endoplasmic reticulum-like isoform X1 [Eriocheir sinensis]|uniref:S phase cyclin A-associated protein in the endoplasmic reticulum-like isoform X1 n=2 Tax=Eriocheir sinensis TaxID=95602 RepID=UPI0021C6DEBB|nr:S phase cyclin A-associated protein in the endoplasmic reticulum-like isoform X1 [Eriocheir sinensis]XP_050730271.1 S phase cyclin A-associated protein in the endoplasmic reticulum-like isoform X1 [Eriocheir sinensis]XP_050730277.1 S phase cyclin A-associated protein in the endoplasmic reticulum-like isoform X1 [Eriocheir sinensis]XP_050730285.1 S phase cyclin A-associated protein in the endoplasmic reticulum-like isoform X1 [Eriocheir sinensis]XP_050730294.1 S phase cyclin A-associated prot